MGQFWGTKPDKKLAFFITGGFMFFVLDYSDQILAVARTLNEAKELAQYWNVEEEEGHYVVPAFFSKLKNGRITREFNTTEETEQMVLENRLK
jgi:hypothetical protein